MVNYRRNKIEGGIYFFTVTLKNRESTVLIQNINLLISSFKKVKRENKFETIAMVVLPDHIHAIWQLPEGDSDYSLRWRKIKSGFTRSLLEKGALINKNKNGEYDLWQRRFWEHTIKDDSDLENHVNYIHYNPVKHKLVNSVKDWQYSTFHRYVNENMLEKNWLDDSSWDSKNIYGE